MAGISDAPIHAPLKRMEEKDELLHAVPANAPFDTTETSYFGFNIPEKGINGEYYLWLHPQLKVASAGVYVWQGEKRTTLAADYFDYWNYLPYLEGDLDSYELPTGQRAKVIKPLEEIELTCANSERGFSLELSNKAIMPAGGRPDGFHFSQAMKTEGTLKMNGEEHRIDGYFTRDRSWSQPREEMARPIPPIQWMVGVFDDDFAFHVSGFEDPAKNPIWSDAFPPLSPEYALRWGYVWRNGELFPVTAASIVTQRTAAGAMPTGVEVTLTDAGGETFEIVGKGGARLPLNVWPNMTTYFTQTQWTTRGRTGWGDLQDIQFPDFVRKFGG